MLAPNQTENVAPLVWNPYARGFRENPYPFLNALRQSGSVQKAIDGNWVVLGYADVKNVLSNSAFKSLDVPERILEKRKFSKVEDNFDELYKSITKWLMYLNPPEHTETRKALMGIWNSYKITPFIEATLNDCFDVLEPDTEIDFITDIADHIPLKVICHMLGFSTQNLRQLRKWAFMQSFISEPFSDLNTLREIDAHAEEFSAFIKNQIVLKKANPGKDITSDLLAHITHGKPTFTEDEITSLLHVIFFAGIETSILLLGCSLYELMLAPEAYADLCAHPDIAPVAIEELLRYVSPGQNTMRQAIEDVNIDNVTIRTGECIYVSVAAANRDPAAFKEPETLNIRRQQNLHVAFGYGIHHCLGAKLARTEGTLFLQKLASLPFKFELNGKPGWKKYVLMRGLESLPVRVVSK